MSNNYTDEIAETAWNACADVRDSYPRNADDAPSDEVVEAILDAVAPAIAARAKADAIRTAADWIVDSMTCSTDERARDRWCDGIREAAEELRWYADEIEGRS